MSADLNKMINNLLNFYDFDNKTAISIGAGGGQFFEYAFKTKSVIAVDIDINGIESLKRCLVKEGILDKFTLVHSDFYDFKAEGDILMFDYCLHEIMNPCKAIKHALTMSQEVLINDHWTESEWAYIVDEEEKVKESWKVIRNINSYKIERYDTFQFFHDYNDLYQKVKGKGENTIARIEKYRNLKKISIPMSYGMALIRRIDNVLL